MKLSPKQIQKFQDLYEKRFGQKVSKEKAYELGMKLVALVQCTHNSFLENKKRNERRIKNETKQNGV